MGKSRKKTDSSEPVKWITVHGVHIPVYEGDSRKKATSRVIAGITKKTSKTASFDKTQSLEKTKKEVTVTLRNGSKKKGNA